MSLGASLIWITFILCTIGGLYLVTRARKWRLVAKLLATLILIFILIGVGTLFWGWYTTRPYVATSIGDVSLGMTPLEVTLALGAPSVDSKYTEETDEYRRFVYNDYSNELDYFIRFSKGDDATAKAEIVCTEVSYRNIFGLGKYSSEKQVVAKLGKPTSTSIKDDGLGKFISYLPWKVAFLIEKGQVQSLCVTESGKVSFLQEYGTSAAK